MLTGCGGGSGTASDAETIPACTPTTAKATGGTPYTTQVDWPYYGADAASTKYRPVSQITADNFADLEVQWVWCAPDEAAVKKDDTLWPGNNESTPLMVDGVLYSTTPLSEAAAVDPMTGETLWTYDPRTYDNGSPPNLGYINRGLAYWADGTDKRIFLATGDARLIALIAADGKPDRPPSGTTARSISSRACAGRRTASTTASIRRPWCVGIRWWSGATIHDKPDVKDMPPGDVRGFDARTGVLKWDFKTIPQAGEYGNDTWGNDSWVDAGSTNVWTSMSCDQTLGLVYLPLSAPNNDYFGGDRPGDNLFSQSEVAVNGETGARVWSFQAIHHGIWDYDFPGGAGAGGCYRGRHRYSGGGPGLQAGLHLCIR